MKTRWNEKVGEERREASLYRRKKRKQKQNKQPVKESLSSEYRHVNLSNVTTGIIGMAFTVSMTTLGNREGAPFPLLSSDWYITVLMNIWSYGIYTNHG